LPTECWGDFRSVSMSYVIFPLLGRDRRELGASLRGRLIDGYVAFYVVERERIVIVRVIDGRRDMERELSK
jgi:toxin ParE1/3/4